MTSRGSREWSGGALPLIAPDTLSDLIAATADLSLVISDVGLIVSVLVNPEHRSFGSLAHWEGRDIRDVLKAESVPKIEARLERFSTGERTSRPIELNHTDGSDWEFPVRYTLHRIGDDGSILMLGRDLRPVAEIQQQLVRAQLALERDYEVQRDFDTRFRVLMEASPDALAFVALGTGRITELNRAAASLIGGSQAELAGAAVAQELEWEGRQDVETLIEKAVPEEGGVVEVRSRRSGKILSVAPTAFRSAGERIVLLRLSAEAQSDDRAGGVARSLVSLFENGAEAIVFTDRTGEIATANESFLNLVDAADLDAVRGHTLSDFLSRGAVDLRVLLENAQRAGRMRFYGARAVSVFGAETAVEISATWLEDREAPAVAFVMRDSGRAEPTRTPSAPKRSDEGRGVRELVGSATLKEIVSETTDVIEKMCIETALELTGDNRVAASEMLGLSRQSLYVKLRKYGLLSREPGVGVNLT
jgi:transcriptional regulator PpsR